MDLDVIEMALHIEIDNTIDTSNTYYLDTLDLTTDALVKKLGAPIKNDNCKKNQYEWRLRVNGNVYSVYDWVDDNTEWQELDNRVWHIGGEQEQGIDISAFVEYINTDKQNTSDHGEEMKKSIRTTRGLNILHGFRQDWFDSDIYIRLYNSRLFYDLKRFSKHHHTLKTYPDFPVADLINNNQYGWVVTHLVILNAHEQIAKVCENVTITHSTTSQIQDAEKQCKNIIADLKEDLCLLNDYSYGKCNLEIENAAGGGRSSKIKLGYKSDLTKEQKKYMRADGNQWSHFEDERLKLNIRHPREFILANYVKKLFVR